MNPLFTNLPTTIFTTMSGLATEHGAINLGQGFPDTDGFPEVREAAARALLESSNQYAPMQGLPVLRAAIAAHYGAFQGLDLDWRSEVLVTSGATEAIAAALLATVSPGDKVVLIEPMYDAYLPLVRRAGGEPRFVRLKPPAWRLDETELAAAFADGAKAIVVNTPGNPTTGVLDAEQLALIAKYCVAHDAVAISDEVWEHVTFDGRPPVSMMAAPGMRERTIKIGSAGKIFALTGWKVGFVCAAPPLAKPVAGAHQFLTFATPPNLQAAAAFGLGLPAEVFDQARARLGAARDRLANGLRGEGFDVLPTAGTYFLNVDLGKSGIGMADHAFALQAVREAGVAVIPVSAFYHADPSTHLMRLCFAKRDETLDRGVEALSKARRLLA